jgi:alkanesulfonate monooxygenase SsuD/methylene tetrahydromethanopterin reductase-like flavin-dependent oxidoreductase (luciferase family)
MAGMTTAAAVGKDGGMTALGLIFPPDRPPEQLRSTALAADRSGLEQLWLWEDCFKESGIATAASVLAWTERLAVGIGLLPVPLRNVALTAMEIATLERLFPGRLVPGIGHGVQEWMGQVGVRAASPMTLLGEYAIALRSLLQGERVTTSGRYVELTDVALDWPPSPPPPVLVGAVREKTVGLAGERADGVILSGETAPARLHEVTDQLLAARAAAGRAAEAADVVAFVPVENQLPAAQVAARLAEYADGGATHLIVLAVGDEDADLAGYAGFLAREVRPLIP